MSSSGKLDQSLDEILSTQRKAAGRRSNRRAGGRPAATAAPSGGVKKNVKPARNAGGKPAPTRGSGLVGESKIMVSNLPKDVSEAQIKEYFQQAIGQVKRVELSYGPGGVSRGTAHITFHHADGASKAFEKLNGMLIDSRPVKVEVVIASADLIPQPKSLGQRISQPKAQPKSAATVKHGAGANAAAGAKTGAAAKNSRNKPRRARSGRPTKKTAEELDSEMADYFVAGSNENGAAAPAAAPAAATSTDAPMDDDIL
ncbi:hypothetical protein GE09DRAFT_1075205 [Coniochaeta sp. 2T2.1]|nr:hypothetical protein GE09DRAFT_1075205 [Coniochaeta sp. 2T2.1]